MKEEIIVIGGAPVLRVGGVKHMLTRCTEMALNRRDRLMQQNAYNIAKNMLIVALIKYPQKQWRMQAQRQRVAFRA